MDKIKPYDPKGSSYAERIPAHRWDEMRPVVEQLHHLAISRRRMLEILAEEHNFFPSKTQLNARLKAWDYNWREGPGNGEETHGSTGVPTELAGIGGFGQSMTAKELDQHDMEIRRVLDFDLRVTSDPCIYRLPLLDLLSDVEPPSPRKSRYQDPHCFNTSFPTGIRESDMHHNILLDKGYNEDENFCTKSSDLQSVGCMCIDCHDSDVVMYDLQSTSSFRSFRRAGKSTKDVHGPSSICGASTFSAGSMKTLDSAKLVERLFPKFLRSSKDLVFFDEPYTNFDTSRDERPTTDEGCHSPTCSTSEGHVTMEPSCCICLGTSLYCQCLTSVNEMNEMTDMDANLD